MKRMISMLCLILALCMGACSASAASAYSYSYAYSAEDYTNLLGSMEVVNVKSYTWMKDRPGMLASKVVKVPVGAVVTNCYYYDGKYVYCEYEGYAGYLPNSNLSFICGPVGYEYPESAYLGNYQIVNCTSYATLRAYPDSSSQRLMQVPLGAIVTNVYYQDSRFSYCVYGNMDGYILNSNLSWVSGGNGGASSYLGGAVSGYIGTARVVNCLSYASLRQYPDTHSVRLCRVPFGDYVSNVTIVDDRFAYCEYGGYSGYILLDNLGW